MLVDVHLRNANGSPGRMIDTVEAERLAQKVKYKGREYPVLTGVRNFIVIEDTPCKNQAS